MAQGDKLRVLVIGAHPDDCELTAGGVAALYARNGHVVRFVSVANGDAGHHEMGGAPLARRRKEEAADAARVIGIESEVMDNSDCEIMPTLELRKDIIRLIRNFRPDVIMTHRPVDYHPDHRYTSQVVQDAAYTVTVPNTVALTDHLRANPVIMFLNDRIEEFPFRPDVIIDIDDVYDKKLEMIHRHTSQMYEWLPYNRQEEDAVPEDELERKRWLADQLEERMCRTADQYRHRLLELYGEEQGQKVRYAEAFQICSYGSRPPNLKELHRLFPFFPEPR